MAKELSEYSTAELKAMKAKLLNMVDEQENLQMAIKILINSAYGAIGSKYFRFFNVAQASGITISGQTTILSAERGLNNYMDKLLGVKKDRIIAIDTDSVYMDLTDLVKKVCPTASKSDQVDFLAKVCKTKLQDKITEIYDDVFTKTNSLVNKMVMKREAIGSAVFVQKKRYIMRVYDNEGVRYATPKAKVMGLEAVRSSTPEFFRKKLKDFFMRIFDDTQEEIISGIAEVRSEFEGLRLEEYATTMGVSSLKIPKSGRRAYNAKAAVLYNDLIEKHGLEKKYELIKGGDKMKLCPLKIPNPVHQNYIAFPAVLPPEFDMEKWVDKDQLFDNNFKGPMQRVLDVFGWKVEDTADVSFFF